MIGEVVPELGPHQIFGLVSLGFVVDPEDDVLPEGLHVAGAGGVQVEGAGGFHVDVDVDDEVGGVHVDVEVDDGLVVVPDVGKVGVVVPIVVLGVVVLGLVVPDVAVPVPDVVAELVPDGATGVTVRVYPHQLFNDGCCCDDVVLDPEPDPDAVTDPVPDGTGVIVRVYPHQLFNEGAG